MTDKKVWFITGAGRGMGVGITKAALAAGHGVVATGRDPERVSAAIGDSDDLLTVKLDVTDTADVQGAVQAAVDRFGRIDVLVNNAGNFNAGFFEEIAPEDFRAQIETTLFGPVNVTRQEVTQRRVRVGVLEPGGVATELGSHNRPEIRDQMIDPFYQQTEVLAPEDIADGVAYMITRPRHTAIGELWIMPTNQI